jgi:hypothetical protein
VFQVTGMNKWMQGGVVEVRKVDVSCLDEL